MLKTLIGDSLLSENQRLFLLLAEQYTGGLGVDMDDAELVDELKDALEGHRERVKIALSNGTASVKRGRVIAPKDGHRAPWQPLQ